MNNMHKKNTLHVINQEYVLRMKKAIPPNNIRLSFMTISDNMGFIITKELSYIFSYTINNNHCFSPFLMSYLKAYILVVD